MIAMGKIVQDHNGYLDTLKAWGDHRCSVGPPLDGKKRKVYRALMDLTRMLEDLEGEKPAMEKAVVANQVIHNLLNLLILANDLWPMHGKWIQRVIEPVYPGLTAQLFEALKASLGSINYTNLLTIIDEHIAPIGGRVTEYNTLVMGDEALGNGPTQVVMPNVFLSELGPEALAALHQIVNRHQSFYLKSFDEVHGALGIVCYDRSHSAEAIFEILGEAGLSENRRYSYEPVMEQMYGGLAAFEKVGAKVLHHASRFASGLYLRHQGNTDREALLGECAYGYAIFCAAAQVAHSNIHIFSEYLYRSWCMRAIDPNLTLGPKQSSEEKYKLSESLNEKVVGTDPEMLEMLTEIVSSPETRFDEPIFDTWADGLAGMKGELTQLTTQGVLTSPKYQILTLIDKENMPDEAILWPIFERYLNCFFDLLDIDVKDRLYLVSLLRCSQQY